MQALHRRKVSFKILPPLGADEIANNHTSEQHALHSPGLHESPITSLTISNEQTKFSSDNHEGSPQKSRYIFVVFHHLFEVFPFYFSEDLSKQFQYHPS